MFVRVRLLGNHKELILNTDNVTTVETDRFKVHTTDGETHILTSASYERILRMLKIEVS